MCARSSAAESRGGDGRGADRSEILEFFYAAGVPVMEGTG
jgi:hypothetical protein